jgi:hypothetical protein
VNLECVLACVAAVMREHMRVLVAVCGKGEKGRGGSGREKEGGTHRVDLLDQTRRAAVIGRGER